MYSVETGGNAMSEWILYACASAVLGGMLPSLMKTGVRRAAPAVAAALYAAMAFLFALAAAAIVGTLEQVRDIGNATLLWLLLAGMLRALLWLCLFTALSTGGGNRVMPIHNLAAAAAVGATALFFGGSIGIWRLCCLVLLLLGTVLMESRQQRGRGYRWLLFAFFALMAATALQLVDARLLGDMTDSVQVLLESLVAAVLLLVLAAAGGTLKSLKKLQFEDYLYLLLSGLATGLAWLCDAATALHGDSTYLLPIACCAFPLMMLFARLFHKEKLPAAAALGLVLAVAGMFGLLLNV